MYKLVHAAFRGPDGTSYCCGALHDLNCLPDFVDPDSVEDGFLTDTGEFLTRDQATQELHVDHLVQSEELGLEKTEFHGTDKKEYEHVVRTWLQQRLRDKLGPRDPLSDIKKSMADICPLWKCDDDDIGPEVMGAASRQAGFDVLELPEFRAAKFMAGGRDLDPEREREALRIHGDDVVAAALWAQGLEITDANRDGLKAIMAGLQDPLKKADLDVAALPRDVEPVFSESQEVVDALRRAFVQRNVKRMALKGKHSAGVAVAYDEKTEKHYLLKPGSGALSPAAGIREEGANQSRREVAFVKIAQAWGIGDDFPGCELVLVDGQEVAVMDLLDPDYVNIGKVRESAAKILRPYEENGKIFKWAVLDFILGQCDRHSGNLMCNSKDHDKVKLIDEGSTFAGPSFAPGQDMRSYIPYYLRAFAGQDFKKLSPEERLNLFPRPDPELSRVLETWIQGLSETETRGLLVRYGISLNATLDRLNAVQAAEDGIEYVLRRWAGFRE